jgi:hypothetical protein
LQTELIIEPFEGSDTMNDGRLYQFFRHFADACHQSPRWLIRPIGIGSSIRQPPPSLHQFEMIANLAFNSFRGSRSHPER